MFNSKQGAAGKGGDETIWLEKDVLGPLAGTNTAFLFQVIYHGLYKCEKVKFSTINLIVFRQATGGVKLRLQAAQSMPTAIIWLSTGFTFYTIQHSTLTITDNRHRPDLPARGKAKTVRPFLAMFSSTARPLSIPPLFLDPMLASAEASRLVPGRE